MFGDIIQPTHLLFILVVALLVLGPKRLPEVGRSLGKGLRDFRQGMQGVQDEARSVFGDMTAEPDEPPASTTVSALPETVSSPIEAEPATAPTVVDSAVDPTDAIPAVEPLRPALASEPVAAVTVATAQTPRTTAPVFEPDPADYAD